MPVRPSNLNPQATAQAQLAQTQRQKKALAAILALLTAGAVGYGLLIGIRGILVSLGLAEDVAMRLAQLVTSQMDFPDFGLGKKGPVQKHEERQALAWRSLYILAAEERIADAGDDLERAFKREHSYFLRHLAAEERRLRAAALVDVTAELLGDRTEEQLGSSIPLLGWRAVIDKRTTSECRWANGMNFRADRIPIIGIPGGVHPRCRCTAGPPIEGAPLIPSL